MSSFLAIEVHAQQQLTMQFLLAAQELKLQLWQWGLHFGDVQGVREDHISLLGSLQGFACSCSCQAVCSFEVEGPAKYQWHEVYGFVRTDLKHAAYAVLSLSSGRYLWVAVAAKSHGCVSCV